MTLLELQLIATEDAPIKRIEMDGLEFSRQSGSYDKILIKEAIHHIAERGVLFANLFAIRTSRSH